MQASTLALAYVDAVANRCTDGSIMVMKAIQIIFALQMGRRGEGWAPKSGNTYGKLARRS